MDKWLILEKMKISHKTEISFKLGSMEQTGKYMEAISGAYLSSNNLTQSRIVADHAATGMIPDIRHYSDDNSEGKGSLTARLLDLEQAGKNMEAISGAYVSANNPTQYHIGTVHAATGMIPDICHYSDDNSEGKGSLTAPLLDLEQAGKNTEVISGVYVSSSNSTQPHIGTVHAATGMIPDICLSTSSDEANDYRRFTRSQVPGMVGLGSSTTAASKGNDFPRSGLSTSMGDNILLQTGIILSTPLPIMSTSDDVHMAHDVPSDAGGNQPRSGGHTTGASVGLKTLTKNVVPSQYISNLGGNSPSFGVNVSVHVTSSTVDPPQGGVRAHLPLKKMTTLMNPP
jgi:hypothetical protein